MERQIISEERVLKDSDRLDRGWVLSHENSAHFRKLKERSLSQGKPMVLWGWKRDRIEGGVRFPESRTVYFSADLDERGGEIKITRGFFFLETRAKHQEIHILQDQIGDSRMLGQYQMKISEEVSVYQGYSKLSLVVGEPTDYDYATVARRLKGKPRNSISPEHLVQQSQGYDLSRFAPMALCVGSGLSSESGLPLLGAIHNLFEVDNSQTGKLIFGSGDSLPRRVVADAEGEFAGFCQFTIDAIKAQPSDSHKIIADLYQKGIVRQIFTDNMDDILDKIQVPYTATRQGIFPDKYLVEFDSNMRALLVIGVAVDRRQVIKQARAAGLKIIVVNPVMGVAPHSRNMDYMREGDMFFRQKAYEALPMIIEASGF